MLLIEYYTLPLELLNGEAGLVEQLQCNEPQLAVTSKRFVALCLLDVGLEPLGALTISPDLLASGQLMEKLRIVLPRGTLLSFARLKNSLVLVAGLSGSLPKVDSQAIAVLSAAGEEFLSILEADFSLSLSLSISNLFTGLVDCEAMVRDALMMADFSRFIQEPVNVVDLNYYHGMKTLLAKQHPEFHLVNYERPLISAVLNRNYAHAELVVQKLLIAHLCDPLYVFPGMRSTIVNTLRLAMALSTIDPKIMSDEDKRLPDLQWEVQKCATLQKMKQLVHRFFGILDEYSQQEQELGAGSLKTQRIMEYILEQYGNPQLDGALVSSHFNISPSYLSRLFKEHMGINLSVFLQTVRIKKAKELLANTDLPIDSIAMEVGFLGRQSLLRLFKKFEDITPTVYRSLVRGEVPPADEVKN